METERFVEFHQALYSIKTRETFKDMFEFFFWELSWKDTEVHNRRMAVSRECLLPSAGSCWDHLHLVGGKLKPLLNTSYEAFKRGWRQYVKGKGKQGCNILNWRGKASVLWTTSTLFLQHRHSCLPESSCFSLFCQTTDHANCPSECSDHSSSHATRGSVTANRASRGSHKNIPKSPCLWLIVNILCGTTNDLVEDHII